jgi:pimeloyl-ACP methyl ester carboxylesterase
MTFLLIIITLAVLLHLCRQWFANKQWTAPIGDAFNGQLMALGDNLVCIPDRSHLDAAEVGKATLICFPGFLEDMRYFLEVHKDTPARLIIINNANYQNPFNQEPTATPSWFVPPFHPLGTIAHDAHCLNQVLQHLCGNEKVILHGHSRGGAVVLEAGNQQPQRVENIEVLLEAAVVPQGRLAGNLEKKLQPVGFYLAPFIFALMRRLPRSLLIKSPMMWVTNPAKENIVANIPFTPKQYSTAVTNNANIIDWHAKAGYNYYDNFQRISLITGQRDSVLWLSAMLKSAAHAERVNVIKTEGTDHFISLEKPDIVRQFMLDSLQR